MRSVSVSAWRISSIDSARVCAASFTQPQFSCILACRKYWLIAVSSAVSCSLRNSMTFSSPRMNEQTSPRRFGSGHPQPGGIGTDAERAATAAGPDQLFERLVAGAAAGAGVGDVADRRDGGRAPVDGVDDLAVGHRVADAGKHRSSARVRTRWSPAGLDWLGKPNRI